MFIHTLTTGTFRLEFGMMTDILLTYRPILISKIILCPAPVGLKGAHVYLMVIHILKYSKNLEAGLTKPITWVL